MYLPESQAIQKEGKPRGGQKLDDTESSSFYFIICAIDVNRNILKSINFKVVTHFKKKLLREFSDSNLHCSVLNHSSFAIANCYHPQNIFPVCWIIHHTNNPLTFEQNVSVSFIEISSVIKLHVSSSSTILKCCDFTSQTTFYSAKTKNEIKSHLVFFMFATIAPQKMKEYSVLRKKLKKTYTDLLNKNGINYKSSE